MSSVVKRLDSIPRMWMIDCLFVGFGCEGKQSDRLDMQPCDEKTSSRRLFRSNLTDCKSCTSFFYLLLGQCVQLLDVRRDERVESDQNLLHRQGGQEETQSLHQPHALAALHTDTQEHTQDTSYMTSSQRRAGADRTGRSWWMLKAVYSPYGFLSPARPTEEHKR